MCNVKWPNPENRSGPPSLRRDNHDKHKCGVTERFHTGHFCETCGEPMYTSDDDANYEKRLIGRNRRSR